MLLYKRKRLRNLLNDITMKFEKKNFVYFLYAKELASEKKNNVTILIVIEQLNYGSNSHIFSNSSRYSRMSRMKQLTMLTNEQDEAAHDAHE